MCLSPKYFAQMIYKESGKHAKDWIRDFVIKDAKAMLKSGNYTVQEVSETLHFANQSFFGKYFKDAVGCSRLPRRKLLLLILQKIADLSRRTTSSGLGAGTAGAAGASSFFLCNLANPLMARNILKAMIRKLTVS